MSREMLPGEVKFDCEKAILHIDVDAFYAQVEERRDPSLRSRPLGITQKYLIVTCNYPARRKGVTKLMRTSEARKQCPDLVLVSGEDLTPYREASKQIISVAKRFGTVEKLGLDEVFVDVTQEAHQRVQGNYIAMEWAGHLHASHDNVYQHSRHRPMDLRASEGSHGGSDKAPLATLRAPDDMSDVPVFWKLLKAASHIASDLRQSLKAETGLRCSAGIACNRLLAKLCSGLHKPDDQTILPPPEALGFVSQLPVRAISGVGSKTARVLKSMGIENVADMQSSCTRESLIDLFGKKTGSYLFEVAHGRDPTEVVEKGPPQSITVEDSFTSCTSLKTAEEVVKVLAPDLVERFREEFNDSGRWPKTLVVKWRERGSKFHKRSSCSSGLPDRFSPTCTRQGLVTGIIQTAIGLLAKNLNPSFNLTLISIGGTGFSDKRNTHSQATLTHFLSVDKEDSQYQSPNQGLEEFTQEHTATGGPKSYGLARKSYSRIPLTGLPSKRKERELREEGKQAAKQLKVSSDGSCQETGAALWATTVLQRAAAIGVDKDFEMSCSMVEDSLRIHTDGEKPGKESKQKHPRRDEALHLFNSVCPHQESPAVELEGYSNAGHLPKSAVRMGNPADMAGACSSSISHLSDNMQVRLETRENKKVDKGASMKQRFRKSSTGTTGPMDAFVIRRK